MARKKEKAKAIRRTKKKTLEEVSYKVVMPIYFGFYKWQLAKFFSKHSAEKYIESFFNPFIRPLLFIEEEKVIR